MEQQAQNLDSPSPRYCTLCGGTGGSSGASCSSCGGSGWRMPDETEARPKKGSLSFDDWQRENGINDDDYDIPF